MDNGFFVIIIGVIVILGFIIWYVSTHDDRASRWTKFYYKDAKIKQLFVALIVGGALGMIPLVNCITTPVAIAAFVGLIIRMYQLRKIFDRFDVDD